tara:strand:- start:1485 stop:2603 length:1119 start_codon:yes stop_codon:yes gene_type:complete
MPIRLLIFAPSRRGPTETFIRSSIERLPFEIDSYFGDEFFSCDVLRVLYGLSVLLSKILTRLRLLRLATIPSSLVASLLIFRHRPNVVMAEFGFHAVRVMEIALLGVPLIVQFHGADASAFHYLVKLNERYKRLMKLSSGVVVKNASMRERLIRLGAIPNQIIISPSCPDEKIFTNFEPQAMPPHFLAVGRFVSKKSPLDTLGAFVKMRSISEKYKSATLEMIGDGPLFDAVQNKVHEMKLENLVTLPGMLPPQEVAEAMRRARAFVQHSRRAADGDEEGCPVSIIEAQLCGLPVISTFHGGIPDVVLDGQTGRLVEEGDTSAMALAMAEVIDNPRLAKQFGKAGQLRSRKYFTLDCHIKQMSDFISALVLS